jgi:choline dehydrogenase-like flavoprotein
LGECHRSAFRRARDLKVVLHANLVKLEPAAQGEAIQVARFRALNGGSLDIAAKAFVLCCSAIENARILLNLNAGLQRALPGGDNIGRYFGQHPRGTILTVEADKAESLRLQRAINKYEVRGNRAVQYELGFALSERVQREHKLLNASAGLYYSSSEAEAAKRMRAALTSRRCYRGVRRDLAQLSLNSLSMIRTLWRKYITGCQLYFPAGTIRVVADLEQEPRRDSRITLSAERDALGVPRAVVDWRISEIERATARKFAEAVAGELHRLGFGKATLEPWLTSNEPVTEDNLKGNYHLIGTTRMGRTSHDGVVDENARVFGLSNLYVAGSSIFSTGGHANPTLTIIALAIRLADHLNGVLSQG